MKLRVLQQRIPSMKEEYGYGVEDYEKPIDNKPILQVLENGKWVDIPIVVEWVDFIEGFRKPKEKELESEEELIGE